MKFAFCLFKYFPFGGLQRGFFLLAKECLSRGHQIDVYTGAWEGSRLEGVNVYIIPNRGLTNHKRYVSFADRLDRRIREKKYDAVVGFNKMPGLDVYFASDTCYAASIRDRSAFYRSSSRCKTLLKLERAVFDRELKTHIILISDLEIPEYISYYQTAPDRFHLVPPGISRDRLSVSGPEKLREQYRRELSIGEQHHLVMMVGSGFKTKGVDRAIRAIASLPSHLKKITYLVIVGKGNPFWFRWLAFRLGILSRVIFLGAREDVPRLLRAADMLLHPAYKETAGAVLIEAMAAGLPILVTGNCGYSFHVRRAHAGEVVQHPFVQDSLNRLLCHMLETDGKHKWGEMGRRYVAETDISSRAQKAANIIEKVVL